MTKLATMLAVLGLFLAVSSGANGQDAFEFGARLSGLQEPQAGTVAPPAPQPGIITTPPTVGNFAIAFDENLTQAGFRLDVLNGLGITQAHLHCGAAGVNGPIVAFLFGLVPAGVNVNGTLATGVLTNASIQPVDFSTNAACGRTINNIASLHAAALERRIYVNVHSLAFPGGVTRAQLIQGFNPF
jgi:hypothetical protein